MREDEMPAVGDPLDGGMDSDPAAFIAEAAQQGMVDDDAPRETDAATRDFVRAWFQKTKATPDFTQAVERRNKDLLAIYGGTQAEVDDHALITVNHIYRNAMQTVALTVPEHINTTIQAREEVELLPGMQVPPQVAQELQQRKYKQDGIASVVSLLLKRFGEDCRLQEKIEGWVQNGTHHRMSIMKVWFQFDIADDPISEERLPDAQDNYANLRSLAIRFARGDFTKDSSEYVTMQNTLLTLGKHELEVKCSIVVEQVPIDQYRIDPSVISPELQYTAKWECHDIPKKRCEILALFPEVKAVDLERGDTYEIDDEGKLVKQDREARASTNGQAASTLDYVKNDKNSDDDLLLVREIYDYETNHRITLIEGLDYPAAKTELDKMPFGNSPFVLFVANRAPDRLYGLSDTELQDKIQAAINRTRTNEEKARDNAQPRWGYDPAAINEKGLGKLSASEPWSFNPIPVSGKGTLADSIVPLAGNHEFNPQEYDITRHLADMRAMAMLPEQALGVTGQAQFATEVEVAAAGATIMAKYRMTRIKRAIKQLVDKAAQLILWNIGVDKAVKYAGPLAALVWPHENMSRWDIYETLRLDIDIAMDRQLDYAKRVEALVKVLEVLNAMAVPLDKELLAKLLVKYLDLGDEGENLIKLDPNDLTMRLQLALQSNPQALAPEMLMALANMGAVAQQVAANLMAQQAAQGSAQSSASAGGAPSTGAVPTMSAPAQANIQSPELMAPTLQG